MGFDPHVVMNQMQSFESNPELFNLTAGMEMLAFPSKNRDGNFISKAIINESTNDFFQTGFHKPDFAIGFSETTTEHLIVASDSSGLDNNRFLPDNSSLRCVFPCEGNERPSKGLSLSMCSDKHSNIGIESFELRETTSHRKNIQPNQGFFSKSTNFQQQLEIQKDEFVGKSLNLRQTHLQLKNSKYLAPAHELLTEFCSIGTKQTERPNKKPHKFNQWEEENGGHESKTVLLNSLDLLQLQKRKTKLISMIEEVDRRYSQYCDQMKAVVSSLEAVVGTGAATVYSASALKAMSKHFRCLRDGIVDQVKATNKAIEDKDHTVAPGTSRGETPRLRLLDQTLRQQKAFQQMRMMDSPPWRSQRGLPERSVSVLRAWLFEHFLHPYPSDVDKLILARQTGLSRSQVSNWFINARVRLWKPMVEEMYLEETKEQDNLDSSDGIADFNYHMSQTNIQNPFQDHKPTAHEPLVRRDSDALSSIVNNPEVFDDVKDGSSHYHQQQQHRQFGSDPAGIFGVTDVDYSTYNNQDHTSNAVFHNGVSLTLGLQQHGRSGVNIAFSPPSQHSLFTPRVHIEDCDEQVDDQYSMLNGEPHNLPYRKLMGTQLLHDLAG